MLDWGSSTLDNTASGIVGTVHCWYGFGYCTVLMLAVLTDGRWKLAATYCNSIRCPHCGMVLQTDPGRSTPCRIPTAALQTSQWQWTARVLTTWYCTGSSSSLFTADKCLQQYLTWWFGFWTGVPNKCVRWHCASYYRSLIQWQSVQHIAEVLDIFSF